MMDRSTPEAAKALPKVWRNACGWPSGTPEISRWYRKIVRRPAAVKGRPRLAPLATRNSRCSSEFRAFSEQVSLDDSGDVHV